MDAGVHVQELQSAATAHLQAWQQEGRELFKIARAAGIDTTAFATFAGPSGQTASTTRARRRARRATGGGNGGGRTRGGQTVTGEQIMGWLQEHGPANQSTLGSAFGTSRQTIAKRLADLVEGGQVERIGSGAATTWQARELIPA